MIQIGQYKEDKENGLMPNIESFKHYYFKNIFSPDIRDLSLCDFLGLTQNEYETIMNDRREK